MRTLDAENLTAIGFLGGIPTSTRDCAAHSEDFDISMGRGACAAMGIARDARVPKDS